MNYTDAGVAPHLILASGASNYTDSLVSFAWIMGAALLAPLISHLFRNKLPAVALLLILGMIIGPSMLNLAHEDAGIGMLKELGVGALFLLAGFEIEIATLRSREARTAFQTWLMCLIACGIGGYFMLHNIPAAIVFAIAVTSTALGTITPMLKQERLIGTRVGNSIFIHGAIGEVAPITAMAILLGTRSTITTMLILASFIIIAVVVAIMPRAILSMIPGVKRAFLSGAGSTNQTIMRLIVLILAVLMAVTAVFELDIVLGAFAAGIILNRIIPDEFHTGLENRLDVLFYSMLIPVFFVISGMNIDWHAIIKNPLEVLAIPLIILLTRGLPVFLRENIHHTGSEVETTRERLQVALYAATGLPMILAVMTVAVDSGIVEEETSTIFVAGGALTVALFPFIAGLIRDGDKNSDDEAASGDNAGSTSGSSAGSNSDGEGAVAVSAGSAAAGTFAGTPAGPSAGTSEAASSASLASAPASPSDATPTSENDYSDSLERSAQQIQGEAVPAAATYFFTGEDVTLRAKLNDNDDHDGDKETDQTVSDNLDLSQGTND